MTSQDKISLQKQIKDDPYGFTLSEMEQALGEEKARELFSALYGTGRKKQLQTIRLKSIFKSANTQKYAFELGDGMCIETVYIKRRDGGTVCVSTEVGCPVGCIFCESGRGGFVRNLTTSEIVQQIICLDKKVNRIVFMGMGEPLFNYDNVIKAIHILRDRNGLNFPTDGITISTIAPAAQMKRLREEHLKIQLTISLHATTQKVRNQIIPYSRNEKIEEVVQAALSYSERHNRRVVIAYLLLQGVNDRPSDIRQLAAWFAGKNVMVNLLEYNPTSTNQVHKPSKEAMMSFKHKLERAGLMVKMRVSHGGNIKAACGQLANQYNRKRRTIT